MPTYLEGERGAHFNAGIAQMEKEARQAYYVHVALLHKVYLKALRRRAFLQLQSPLSGKV